MISGMELFPDDLTLWQAAMTLASAGGSAFAMFKATKAWIRKRMSGQWDQSYKDIQRIYEVIQDLMSDTPANRVLVIKSENGGGIPTPDGEVTNTVTHETCDADLKPIRDLWAKVKLDKSYSRIIMDVNSNGARDVRMSELPETAVLRDLFEACVCQQARMVRVCATGSAMLYLCVCVPSMAALSAEHRLRTQRAAHTLCRIFENHHQLIKRESSD